MSELPPASPGWHRADIIAAVRRKGSNLARLGEEIGLSRKSMSWALGKRHPRANLAIATFIGVDPHEIWPCFFPPTAAPSRAKLNKPDGGEALAPMEGLRENG